MGYKDARRPHFVGRKAHSGETCRLRQFGNRFLDYPSVGLSPGRDLLIGPVERVKQAEADSRLAKAILVLQHLRNVRSPVTSARGPGSLGRRGAALQVLPQPYARPQEDGVLENGSRYWRLGEKSFELDGLYLPSGSGQRGGRALRRDPGAGYDAQRVDQLPDVQKRL